MKRQFPGYYPLDDKAIRDLWSRALFVFDANVLLNFYRYSQDTRDAWKNVLATIQDRIWIPFQAAAEFHQNRVTVISQQTTSYAILFGATFALWVLVKDRGLGWNG